MASLYKVRNLLQIKWPRCTTNCCHVKFIFNRHVSNVHHILGQDQRTLEKCLHRLLNSAEAGPYTHQIFTRWMTFLKTKTAKAQMVPTNSVHSL